MKGNSMAAGLTLALMFVLASCAACGYGASFDGEGVKFGRPQDFAAATGVARASELALEATAQALDFKATREAASAAAMATALAQRANATATAAPFQAALAQNRATNEMLRANIKTVATGIGVLVVALFALAIIAVIRKRARVIPRGQDGQLPGVLIGNSFVDPARQIGPAVTAPSGLAVFARWMVGCMAEGRLLPYPNAQRLELADGGADADHYLEAARVAGAVGVASAMYRPDNADGRREKLKLELSQRQGNQMLGLGAPAPMTRIVVTGDSAIERIAQELGDRLPPLALPDAPGGMPAESIPDIVEG
jgi:hypothetical protein